MLTVVDGVREGRVSAENILLGGRRAWDNSGFLREDSERAGGQPRHP